MRGAHSKKRAECGKNAGAALAAVLVELVEPDQHLARLRPVRRPEDAGVVQLVDDARGTAIADAEPALQQRGRAALVLDADLRRLAEQRVALLVRRLARAAL